jgi:hypothetical protein
MLYCYHYLVWQYQYVFHSNDDDLLADDDVKIGSIKDNKNIFFEPFFLTTSYDYI